MIDAEVRGLLPDGVSARLLATRRLTDDRLYRPHQLPIGVLGEFQSNQWGPRVWWDPQNEQLVDSEKSGLVPVHHKTRSRMLHFPIVNAQRALGASMVFSGLERLASEMTFYRGGRHGNIATGLTVLHAFWGVEKQGAWLCPAR